MGRHDRNKEKTNQNVVEDTENTELRHDITDIKESLQNLNSSINEVKSGLVENKKSVTDLLKIIDELREKILEKDNRITALEDKINEMEQYSKKNNIIISGKDLNLHTYSHVTTGEQAANRDNTSNDEDEPLAISEEKIMKSNFINFAKKKLRVSVAEMEIVAIHNLRKRQDGIEPVLIKFSSNAAKTLVITARKKLKGSRTYINDHLTQKNAEIERQARVLKKSNVIHSSWCWNAKIYIKETENSPKKQIRHIRELE